MELEKTTESSADTFIQSHNLSFVIFGNEVSDTNERCIRWRP